MKNECRGGTLPSHALHAGIACGHASAEDGSLELPRGQELVVAFHRVGAGEKTNLWPEVYDPDLKIRITYTTRDMPKNPAQMLVHVWRDERILFHFIVVDRIDGSTTTRSGSREEVVRGLRKNSRALAEFTSEDQFLSYVSSGAELMFEHQGSARAVVLFELT